MSELRERAERLVNDFRFLEGGSEAELIDRIAAAFAAIRAEVAPVKETPELMARATQAVLAIIGVDDRAGAGQAVVSPATQQLAADIASAVIEAIR